MNNRLLAGRYELIEKTGEGGMVIVYKGKDRLLNRFVAIKILRPEYIKDEQFIKNFIHESQAAAGLTHPNIVAVYDVGREGDIYYIVMELAEGITLSEYIRKNGRIEYHEAIQIIRQVCLALETAHSKQLVHRDVKPHNIIMTDQGVKLADFGIAKAVSAATIVGGSDKVMGSVHYFSPEQARGSYVDERSDIYSAGIVMYEMITGKVPFDGDTAVSIALMHINDEMKKPSELVSNVPPSLERIIMKATDKVQTNRYKSAEEMLEDIEGLDFISKTLEPVAYAPKPEPKVEPHVRRKNEDEFDEDEEQFAQPKKKPAKKNKKKLTKKQFYIIIACVVCAIPILYFVLTGVGLFNNSKMVSVPDLTNMTIEQATDLLDRYDLELEEGEPMASAEVDKDLICMQDPLAKSQVKRGTTVTVNLSLGKKKGQVPNLVGTDYENAEAALEPFGLLLGKVSYEESEEAEGTIISQSPEGGQEAEEGTYISIVVSKGGGAVVPNVVGKTLSQAKRDILKAGYEIGAVEYEESESYSKNCVIWQSPDGNTRASKGEAIDIIVSKGAPQAGGEDE